MPCVIRRLDLNALPFSLAHSGDVPDFPVVYAIFNESTVFYVGATRSLLNRWSAHRHNHRLQRVIKRKDVKVAWIACDMESLAEYECSLIRFLQPKINVVRQGKSYHHLKPSYNRQGITKKENQARRQSDDNGK